ncbi:MAG TPA: triose-phosphate isomerase [Candidatus Baltobacteraceae bacterium]|jgi:triosephosphate isomerase|nr:triose-phosphate isomerase [Candidatus Baltobacteraceae bacterium]
MPRTVIAGNWKMHKTAAETIAFFDVFLPLAASFRKGIDVVVAPPFTALPAASARLRAETRVALGAQNVHWEPQGAYTGEISIPMLAEHGVRYVIVGHSERRSSCNEVDLTVHLKVEALLAAGLTPIVAVGETLDEREAGTTDERVIGQTLAALGDISPGDVGKLVLAYEPIWAIGTGHNCDPAEANRVMGAIRGCVDALANVPILYGGSMKADNVASYMAQHHINGGLVGGASLDPTGFATLVQNAG